MTECTLTNPSAGACAVGSLPSCTMKCWAELARGCRGGYRGYSDLMQNSWSDPPPWVYSLPPPLPQTRSLPKALQCLLGKWSWQRWWWGEGLLSC